MRIDSPATAQPSLGTLAVSGVDTAAPNHVVAETPVAPAAAPMVSASAVARPAGLAVPTAGGFSMGQGASTASGMRSLMSDLVRGPRETAEERAESRETIRGYLEEYGFRVVEEDYGTGINLLGVLDGASDAEEIVYLSAHYDTVPHCDGANDNGSAMASILEIARQLADESHDRTLVLAFWDEEELGLVGARAHDTGVLGVPEGKPVLNLNLDAVGMYSDEPGSQRMPPGLEYAAPLQYQRIKRDGFRGNFVTMISDLAATAHLLRAERDVEEEGLDTVRIALPRWVMERYATDLRRSDHAVFWDNGIPAIFVTDGANFRSGRYHCWDGEDAAEFLDYERLTQLTNGLVDTTREILDTR